MEPNTKTRAFLPVAVTLLFCTAACAADLDEIVRKATTALNSDWAADPKYACIEKDEVQKGEKRTSKMFEVVMLDGSDYRLPLAVDDKPLSPERAKSELVKMRDELQRRKAEIPAVRRRRVNEWKSKRDENGELLLDFPTSFTFKVVGEEEKNKHPAYVLSAAPKEGLVPSTRAETVLAGMTGTAWIEKDTFHPMYVECTVEKPVPVYGFLATVLPGTDIAIKMTQVTNSVWLIDEVSMKLKVSKLHLIHSSQETRTTYSQYRPNSQVVDELLAKAGQP